MSNTRPSTRNPQGRAPQNIPLRPLSTPIGNAPSSQNSVPSPSGASSSTASTPAQPIISQGNVSLPKKKTWGMDTNITLNICSLVIGMLGIAISVVFGTAAWIQSGDAHKSLILAKWQSCASLPDNPQIQQSEWCKYHSSTDWDTDFSKRDDDESSSRNEDIRSRETHVLDIPKDFYIPRRIDRSSCHIACTRVFPLRSAADPFWLPDVFQNMITCSLGQSLSPPRSFPEFLQRISPKIYALASKIPCVAILLYNVRSILSQYSRQQRDELLRKYLPQITDIHTDHATPPILTLWALSIASGRYWDFSRLWLLIIYYILVVSGPPITTALSGAVARYHRHQSRSRSRDRVRLIISYCFAVFPRVFLGLHLLSYLNQSLGKALGCSRVSPHPGFLYEWWHMVWFWAPVEKWNNYTNPHSVAFSE